MVGAMLFGAIGLGLVAEALVDAVSPGLGRSVSEKELLRCHLDESCDLQRLLNEDWLYSETHNDSWLGQMAFGLLFLAIGIGNTYRAISKSGATWPSLSETRRGGT